MFLPFVAAVALGQNVSPQLVVGVPLTRGLEDGFSQSTRQLGSESFRGRRSQYIAGVGLEAPLPLRLRLDGRILYRRISYDSSENTMTTGGIPALTISETSAAADRWEFPVGICYRFPRRAVRPFLVTGANMSLVSRRRGRREGIRIPLFGPPSTFVSEPPDELRNHFAAGWYSGVGVELPAGFLRVAPEIRYTLWGRQHSHDPVRGGLQFGRHQIDFFVGLRF